ncbi:MAG: PKD domain-containing protein [Bacteroidales bacterium]|nr:PKD domain-containing protein [Bacteroidales bacterium]
MLTPSYFDIDISMNHTLNISDNDAYFVDIESMPILTICPNEISAQFSASDTIVCQNEFISFYSDNTNNNYNYQWFFPGGTPSYSNEGNTPEVQYKTPGQYDVTLIVSDDFNQDTKIKSEYIQVLAKPEIELGLNKTVCQGEELEIGVEHNAELTYEWSTGESSSTVTIDEEGLYELSVMDSFGCVSSDSLYLNTYPKPTIDSLIVENDVLYIETDSIYDYSFDNGPWSDLRRYPFDQDGYHNLEIRIHILVLRTLQYSLVEKIN